MALQIGKACIVCYACETVCPSDAISLKSNTFVINESSCNECRDNQSSRCIAICPEENAITKIDRLSLP